MKFLYHPFTSLFLLVLLISDYAINDSQIGRISLIVSIGLLLFSQKIYKPIFMFVLIFSSFSALISVIDSQPISIVLLNYDLIFSILRYSAIFTIFVNTYRPGSRRSCSKNIFTILLSNNVFNQLLLFLCIIGLMQKYLFSIDRPPFVFYETNYIAYWYPILLTFSYLVLLKQGHANQSNIFKANGFFVVFSSLILLALSQSITFGITLFGTALFFASCLLFSMIAELKLTQNLLIWIVFVLILIVAFFISFSNIKDSLLINRIIDIFNSKYIFDTFTILAGDRYDQFSAGLEIFNTSPPLNQLFGGYNELLRDISGSVDAASVTPCTGFGSIFVRYGIVPTVFYVSHAFYTCLYLNRKAKLFNLIFYAYTMSLFFGAFLYANLSYGATILFPSLILALFTGVKAQKIPLRKI